jgi:rubrerythrin
MTRAYAFVTSEERAEMVKLYREGHSMAFIARFMERDQRSVKSALDKAGIERSPLRPCPKCGVLITPGQPCPDCAADKEARRQAELDDSSFWGPTLPPIERVVREGPPMCEIWLGG